MYSYSLSVSLPVWFPGIESLPACFATDICEIHYLCGGLCTLQMSGKLPYTFKIRGITISWPVLHVMDGDNLLLLCILQLLEVKSMYNMNNHAINLISKKGSSRY